MEDNIVNEPAPQYNFYSVEEYFQMEAISSSKNEYYEGRLVVMQGASLNHNTIVANIITTFGRKIKNKECRIYPSDLRLKIPSKAVYCYPDSMIICGDPEFTEDEFDTLKNPTIIFEVISKTSEANDRKKFFYYMQIPSVQSIIMISSFEAICIEVLNRQENGGWQLQNYRSLNDCFTLLTCSLEFSLAEIYENVKF